jgi:hypothetical protein
LFSFLQSRSVTTFLVTIHYGDSMDNRVPNGQCGRYMHVRRRVPTYHPSFCVSGAMLMVLPSFSASSSATLPLTCYPSLSSMPPSSYSRRSKMS